MDDGDPFKAAAHLLYRVLGRSWLGSYGEGEVLCTTCFLRREGFINEGDDDYVQSFYSMPATFRGRIDYDVSSFEREVSIWYWYLAGRYPGSFLVSEMINSRVSQDRSFSASVSVLAVIIEFAPVRLATL